MTITILHPIHFQAPARRLITPAEFRDAVADAAVVFKAISIKRLRDYGFTTLQRLDDEQAPGTLEAVKDAIETRPYGEAFPIYNSHCENTILEKNCGHTVYRAWHDLVHVEVEGAFTLPGEIIVVNAQMAELEAHGCTTEDCSLLWYDIMGQLLHAEKWGEFPTAPKAFVEACMCKGLRWALAQKW